MRPVLDKVEKRPLQPVEGQTIVVVEDDATLSELLNYNLRQAGFLVVQECGGRAAIKKATEAEADLVLLDVMLPGQDGVSVVRAINAAPPRLPWILLPARDGKDAVLAGFQAGADDYVTKPFDMDELLARIRARLPRRIPGPGYPEPATLLEGFELDSTAHVLRSSSGEVCLRPKEHDLLALLFSSPGHLFPRNEIVERVWGHRYLPGSRTLDVHIGWLREKMALLDREGPSIQTIRGVGYRLVARSPDS